MTLPAPYEFGLPDKYRVWRNGQDAAVVAALESPRRFFGGVLPTGFGKSLMYMGVGHLGQFTTVVLTSTKALQRQLMDDFGGLGDTVLVQGQRAYVCEAMLPTGALYAAYSADRYHQTTVDQGPCHAGVDCVLKAGGCGYYDAVRHAQTATTIITNYAWWFTLQRRHDVKLEPDLLVCDEAHEAPTALADAIGATIHPRDVYDVLGLKLGTAAGRSAEAWREWAGQAQTRLRTLLQGTQARTREAMQKIRKAQWLLASLERVGAIDPKLLLTSDQDESVRFDVVWAAPYAEGWLFRHVPKVLMTSATFGPHTAELLGIAPNDLELYEAGDGFPLKRRPVYVLTAPTVPAVDHRMTAEGVTLWLEAIDRVLDGRQDRKGIIHTVSYRRRDLLLAHSRHRERMLTHGKGDTAERIDVFRKAKGGAVLVSPSVTTGYDFPYTDCQFQILAKVPFPDGRDPVTKARTQIDERYPAYLAMQEIVQAVGRGMRAEDDQCETFLVDKHFRWFLGKHKDLAPRWFRRALRRVDVLPDPPPALR